MSQEPLQCPICEAVMVYENKQFWRCRVCDTEVWPDEERLKMVKGDADLAVELREQIRWAVGGRYTEVLSLVPSYIKGGSSKSSKRKKKVEPKIPQHFD